MNKEEEITDTEEGFIFRGSLPALDLVNTEIAVRGKPQDLLKGPEDLQQWWETVQKRYPQLAQAETGEAFTPELLEQAKTLRKALRQTFTAITRQEAINPDNLAVINAALAMARTALELSDPSTPAQKYVIGPNGSQLLFQVALSAQELLTHKDRERLHKCGNQRCVLMFYDTTKSATRRWCSADCQNRARSSLNYRKRKEAELVQK